MLLRIFALRRESLFAVGLFLLFVACFCYLEIGKAQDRSLNSSRSYPSAPGDLDPSFDGDGKVITQVSELNHTLHSIAIQPDGKILISGGNSGPNLRAIVVRYNTDGSLDTSFDGDGIVIASFLGSEIARVVTVLPDGKILLVANTRSGTSETNSIGIARYHPDGSLDTTFDGDGTVITLVGSVFVTKAVALQPDGKFVLSGNVSDGVDLNTYFYRYNPDGSLDTTFDGDGKLIIEVSTFDDGSEQIAIQPDGKIVSGGYGLVQRAPNVFDDDYHVVRLNPNGSLDTTFDGDGIVITPVGPNLDRAFGMALQPNGKIILTGFTQDLSFNWDFGTVRYNPDGSLDSTFDGDGKAITPVGGGNDVATSVRIQPDNKIVVGGWAGGATDDFAVVRYSADGSLDTTFGSGGKVITPVGVGNDQANPMAIQADGKIVLAGVSQVGAVNHFSLVRFLGDAVPSEYAPFDFDGDGKTDIGIFRPNVGEWWISRSSNGTVLAAQFGAKTDRITPADYTGDGKSDIAVWRPSTGEWFVLRSEDFSFYAFPFGTTGDVPVPADYDADDKSDAAVFRPSTATWYIRRSTDGGTTIQQFGATTDLPVVSDYDGDGQADIGIFRPGPGEWWINRSTGGLLALQFGNSSDMAVQGDYTGDGKSDVALWRPSTGEWFVLRSEDFSFYAFPFGTTGDVPAPGDYDGDGKHDATVFRDSNATWYSNTSTGGTLIQQFGATGDRPIPNAFVP